MNKTENITGRTYHGTEEQFQDFIKKVFDGLYGTDKNRQCYTYDEAIEKIAELKKKAIQYDVLHTAHQYVEKLNDWPQWSNRQKSLQGLW